MTVEANPGPERDAALFKRKYGEEFDTDDSQAMLQDLLEDEDLPKHLKRQAMREFLFSHGLHSNLLDADDAAFQNHQRTEPQSSSERQTWKDMFN